MKKSIIIIAINFLFTLLCKGQATLINPVGIFNTDTTTHYDTAKVVMLVSDTAQKLVITNDYHNIILCDTCAPKFGYKQDTSFFVDNHTYWITGFEVRLIKCCVNGNKSEYSIYQPEPYYEHIKYLNYKKKRNEKYYCMEFHIS